ncbi:MAG: hypothetical protein R3Y53_11250 [Bacillota bacterium]
MTEKERKKQLQELQQRHAMKSRSKKGKRYEPKSVQTFALRMYVTVIFVGGILTLSLFQSETAQALCQKVKATISEEMPEADIIAMKNHLQDMWQGNFSFTVDAEHEALPTEEITDEPTDETDLSIPVSQNQENGVTGIYYPDVDFEWSP